MKAISAKGSDKGPSVFRMCVIVRKSDIYNMRVLPQVAT
jgi:hypothetical protein